MTDKTIQQHINDDKNILEDPTLSPQMRRHVEDELGHLEKYQANHPDENHDPTAFEMFCDENPDASECKIYED
jgi:ribosome-associated translation inhibitor RaiA